MFGNFEEIDAFVTLEDLTAMLGWLKENSTQRPEMMVKCIKRTNHPLHSSYTLVLTNSAQEYRYEFELRAGEVLRGELLAISMH